MTKLVERNPVIENKLANSIMIALYAFIVFSFTVTVVDIIIRFPLQSGAIDYSDIQVIAINVLGLIHCICFLFILYSFSSAVHYEVHGSASHHAC